MWDERWGRKLLWIFPLLWHRCSLCSMAFVCLNAVRKRNNRCTSPQKTFVLISSSLALRFSPSSHGRRWNILNYEMIKSLSQWNITFQCQNVSYKSISLISPRKSFVYYFFVAFLWCCSLLLHRLMFGDSNRMMTDKKFHEMFCNRS